MSVLSNGRLDLSVAQAAYGAECDLYTDVLRVPRNASPQNIQDAYFARRKHLFQVLSNLERERPTKQIVHKRKQAERKMDAVVSAVRILGDAELRQQYNLERHSDSSIPGLNDSSNSATTDEDYSGFNRNKNDETRRKPSPRKPRSTAVSKVQTKRVVDQDYESTGSTSLVSEEGTFLTYDDDEEEGVELPKRPEGLVDRVQMEFLGALDDTSRSFEQVFNAFTLSGEDIDAVVRRIDKAKHQMTRRN